MKRPALNGATTRTVIATFALSALALLGWQRYHDAYQEQLDLIAARDPSCPHWNPSTHRLLCTPDMETVWSDTIRTLLIVVLGVALLTTVVSWLVLFIKEPRPCGTIDCPCNDHPRRRTISNTVLMVIIIFGVVAGALLVAGVAIPSLVPSFNH